MRMWSEVSLGLVAVLTHIRKQEFLDAGHPVFDEPWFKLNERIFLLDRGQK